jgi:hypothetical protein
MTELSAAIAGRRWAACPGFLFRVLYGLPHEELLSITIEEVRRYLPLFEVAWPSAGWPRELLADPRAWIRRFGRALPDEPEPELTSDAKFRFSLDAVLLAWSYPDDLGILASSCACAILESIEALARKSTGDEGDTGGCGGCGEERPAPVKAPGGESPIEVARSREWQRVLDVLARRGIQGYPDVVSLERLEADLADWERHGMLLIVPESAFLFRR